MSNDAKRTVVPKLRFPEFRNAKGWEQTTLGVEAEFHKGRGISKAEVDPKGSRACIRYGELYTRYGEVIRHVFSRTNAAEGLFLSQKNDVIIPASGETKEDIAKASCVELDGVALGSDLNVIRLKHNGIFLSYFLNGPKRREIAKVAQGDAVVHLYPSQLEQLQIAFPNYKEQQKIADCLTSLDELIAAQGRKVEALAAHKKGLMQQLFPREGETVPRLRFPEFRDNGEWCTVALGTLLVDKPEYGVNAAAVPFSRGLPAYLRITDIDDGGRYISSGKVSVNIDAANECYLNDGDIALARTGASVGKSYRYRPEDGRLVFAGFLIRIRPDKNKVVPALLSNFFTTKKYWDWVRVTSARSGQPGINGTEYATLSVPIPPPSGGRDDLAEQQRIAACLSALDARLAAETEKLAALKTYKKGLIQQLFPSAQEVDG